MYIFISRTRGVFRYHYYRPFALHKPIPQCPGDPGLVAYIIDANKDNKRHSTGQVITYPEVWGKRKTPTKSDFGRDSSLISACRKSWTTPRSLSGVTNLLYHIGLRASTLVILSHENISRHQN
jgi:hypothetical protein